MFSLFKSSEEDNIIREKNAMLKKVYDLYLKQLDEFVFLKRVSNWYGSSLSITIWKNNPISFNISINSYKSGYGLETFQSFIKNYPWVVNNFFMYSNENLMFYLHQYKQSFVIQIDEVDVLWVLDKNLSMKLLIQIISKLTSKSYEDYKSQLEIDENKAYIKKLKEERDIINAYIKEINYIEWGNSKSSEYIKQLFNKIAELEKVEDRQKELAIEFNDNVKQIYKLRDEMYSLNSKLD